MGARDDIQNKQNTDQKAWEGEIEKEIHGGIKAF
jgi:hypothetical protein